jgi:hypothetical protein
VVAGPYACAISIIGVGGGRVNRKGYKWVCEATSGARDGSAAGGRCLAWIVGESGSERNNKLWELHANGLGEGVMWDWQMRLLLIYIENTPDTVFVEH